MKLLLSILFIAALNSLSAQPLLTMEKIFTQLDTTSSGVQGVKKLEFTNMGTKSLTIKGVVTSFDDEKISFPKKAIAPGNSGIITYTYMVSECGKFNRDITVQSNGGDQVIHLKGYVSCRKPKN